MLARSKSIRGDCMKPTAKEVLIEFVLGAAIESEITHDQLKAILKEIEDQHYNLMIKGKLEG